MLEGIRLRRVPLLRLVVGLVTTLVVLLTPEVGALADGPGAGDAGGARACAPPALCPVEQPKADAATQNAGAPAPATLVFFWSVGCRHCEEAKPFLDALETREPKVHVERVEVRQDPEGRRRFLETMKRLDASAVGVPTFVIGRAYVVGYVPGETDREVSALVRRALTPEGTGSEPPEARTIDLPVIGTVDPAAVSLPVLTISMGLVDGVNPCAMWVLIVLLGILTHVKKRGRMILYSTAFIVMSGVVYFVFMTAWTTVFRFVGLSQVATMILGGALLAMGLVNLKEIVWFKKGPSLVVPAKAKPALFRRMRGIANTASVAGALGGILGLAFVVNMVELGCTIGLPAVYTRLLTLRELSSGTRYAYLALYNLAYVVPLFAVALTFIVLHQRLSMTERTAKALKGVSGVLLTTFGALFLFAPDVMLRA